LKLPKIGLVTLARAVITLGAIWLVFRGIDWTVVVQLIVTADLMWLAMAMLVLVLQFALLVWRWCIIIKMLDGGRGVSSVEVAIAVGRSMLLGAPLPSTVGGDVVRAIAVSGYAGAAIAARSVIVDRAVGMVALLVFTIMALPLFGRMTNFGSLFFVLVVALLGAVIALIFLHTHFDWLARQCGMGSVVLADLRQMLLPRRSSGAVIFLALAAQLLGIVLIYQLARALSTPITLLDCLVIVPPTLLISSVPISLGGWGVREGALAAGFALAGADAEAGVATSVLFGLTGPLTGIVIELIVCPLRRGRGEGMHD